MSGEKTIDTPVDAKRTHACQPLRRGRKKVMLRHQSVSAVRLGEGVSEAAVRVHSAVLSCWSQRTLFGGATAAVKEPMAAAGCPLACHPEILLMQPNQFARRVNFDSTQATGTNSVKLVCTWTHCDNFVVVDTSKMARLEQESPNIWPHHGVKRQRLHESFQKECLRSSR